ncbi:MAG: methionine adenosyltransferase domain-containing protein, partial [Proteobacteria bacterium]|nr:methionine adenosyltransferase domain-containing protein [Pseudomonadota bacterium]
MIRLCEAVLPGHPDKFCDQIADAIVIEAARLDPDAYAQVEVGVWSDQIWLSGAVCTRTPFERPLADIVTETGRAIGYGGGNWIDPSRYQITSTLCILTGDPKRWSEHVNDQSIVIGWAGYDAKVAYLPPEQFIAQKLKDALFETCLSGLLVGHGPDGKLLIRLREDDSGWQVEHLLVTLQQKRDALFTDFVGLVIAELEAAYDRLRAADPRWRRPFAEIEVCINPSGPLIEGGSDGDNGQTGRKLVADFYGPRVPLGGGALAGKHISHIDRIGSYSVRQAAIEAVVSGAAECLVRVAYAPNIVSPLDVSYEMIGRGVRQPPEYFRHDALRVRYPASKLTEGASRGCQFLDPALPWNQPAQIG